MASKDDCNLVRAVQERSVRDIYKGAQDGDLVFSQEMGQGVGQDLNSAFAAVKSGNLDELDLTQLGLKGRTARIIGDFLLTINTQDTDLPSTTGKDLVESIRDAQQGVEDLTQLMESVLKIVDEIASFQLPEIGIDPLEFALEGIPGITEAQLIRVLGECQ